MSSLAHPSDRLVFQALPVRLRGRHWPPWPVPSLLSCTCSAHHTRTAATIRPTPQSLIHGELTWPTLN